MTTNPFIPIEKSAKVDELRKLQEKAQEEAINSLVLKKTPESAVYGREGRGGRTFTYVQAWWIIDQLNALFDYDWDWEILDQEIGQEQCWVRGTLSVRSTSDSGIRREFKKSAFGGTEIKKYSSENPRAGKPIDIGDDLKAASTDAFKKAASMIGLAADIYGPHEKLQEEANANKPDAATLKAIAMRYGAAGMSEEDFCIWFEEEDQIDINPQLVSFEEMHKSQGPKVLQKLIKLAAQKQKETVKV